MGEDLGHYPGIVNGGNERQGAAALRTGGQLWSEVAACVEGFASSSKSAPDLFTTLFYSPSRDSLSGKVSAKNRR